MLIELSDAVEEKLRDLSARQGRTVNDLVEEAVWEYLTGAAIADVEAAEVVETQVALAGELHDIPEWSGQGPKALWDGEIRRNSSDHDTIYDDG